MLGCTWLIKKTGHPHNASYQWMIYQFSEIPWLVKFDNLESHETQLLFLPPLAAHAVHRDMKYTWVLTEIYEITKQTPAE